VLEAKSGGRSQIYGWDASTNEIKLLSVNSTGQPANGDSDQARISADGNWIVFRSNARDLSGADGSGLWAIYRADIRTRQLRRLELGRPGQPLRCHLRAPAISGDGALVACLAETDVVPGSVGAGLVARMRPDRADRLVVLEVATGRVLGLGGQR
jgi:Tol biopolymer transport system component